MKDKLKTTKSTKSTGKGRDYTKYEFQGNVYGKGPLVLAVVKEYQKKHTSASLDTLKSVFPRKEFHVPFDVVESARKAKKGRFFLDKDDRIKIANGIAVVTNQWTKDKIDLFIKFVEKNLGFSIKKTSVKKTGITGHMKVAA